MATGILKIFLRYQTDYGELRSSGEGWVDVYPNHPALTSQCQGEVFSFFADRNDFTRLNYDTGYVDRRSETTNVAKTRGKLDPITLKVFGGTSAFFKRQ
jgi:hypothetical protein